jgi:hydroxymethylbilane synthase
MTKKKVIIGSRGSDLALWQANYVRDLLLQNHTGVEVDIEIIQTTGDKILDTSLASIGGKGVFTKEIEVALLENKINIAVHSLKDLPTTMTEGLTLGAIPERAPVEDVFMAKDTKTRLMDLPDGATVATGSLRRKVQILHRRPDLKIIDIRGNVPTRIKKMLDSNWDGMILASAGVHRLGLTQNLAHTISLEWVLPAAGQGALGIECRENDEEIISLLAPLNHAPTKASATAERALLAAMGGGCQVPIGAHGLVVGDKLELTACIAALDGRSIIRSVHTGSASDPVSIGEALAKTLLSQGGQEILDELERLQSPETAVNPHPEV